VNVDRVDLRRLRAGHGPRDGVFQDAILQPLALQRRNELRIAHARDVPLGMEYDSRGDHRAGETAAPHFIHTTDVNEPHTAQPILQRAHRRNSGHSWKNPASTKSEVRRQEVRRQCEIGSSDF
jgi:hypothetical protein